VIFHTHPDNLHWVWDTGLLQHINRNAAAFTAELESRITPQGRDEWQKGGLKDWVIEGHGPCRGYQTPAPPGVKDSKSAIPRADACR
jgi:hypothetical protein